MSYIYVFLTILLNVISQLILKWQALKFGPIPTQKDQILPYFCVIALNPWMWLGFMFTCIGAVCWILAMTRLSLNVAYPYMGLCFVLIMFTSRYLFNDSLSWLRILGLGLIVLGIFVASKG